MDRPLWQIILAIMVLAFATRLAASGIALHIETGHTAMVFVYGVQALCGVMIWASVLWLRRMLELSIWAYGLSIAATCALESFALRMQAPSAAIVQIVLALGVCAACDYGVRHSEAFSV